MELDVRWRGYLSWRYPSGVRPIRPPGEDDEEKDKWKAAEAKKMKDEGWGQDGSRPH
ncbi:MAG: hypothetical protein IIA62_11010 [Nitrospinae bacterium]|nr:hypothetical protein [Nitrospinota bacterium]